MGTRSRAWRSVVAAFAVGGAALLVGGAAPAIGHQNAPLVARPDPASSPAGNDLRIPSTPILHPGPCPIGGPGDPEKFGFECGILIVPERHDRPDGKVLQLAVVVVHATDPTPGLPPVVYLTGGPGGSALLEINFWVGTSLRAHRDIVLIDQRGTGFSKPSLACWELELGPDERTPTDEALAYVAKQVAACRGRLTGAGIDLAAYTTNENAADIDTLRAALGIATWDLYGISYGTRLALEVMRDLPDGVRSAVLDSAYPPQIRAFEDHGARVDRAFDAVIAACQADPPCAKAYPDLGVAFASVMDRLEADKEIYQPDAVPGHTIEAGVRGWLYDTRLTAALPSLIHSADIGNTAPFAHLFESPPILVPEADSQGMNLSVECAERGSMVDPAAVAADAAAHPRWRALLERDEDKVACPIWNVPPARAEDLAAVKSAIPTLIFAGTFDPVTPPAYGALTASTLSRSQLVEVPGFGHGVTLAVCPATIRDAFLADPAARLDTSCVDDLLPTSGRFFTDQVANAGLGRMYHRLLFGFNGPTIGHWILGAFVALVFAPTLLIWGARGARRLVRRRRQAAAAGPTAEPRLVGDARRIAAGSVVADVVFIAGLAVVIVGQPDPLTRDLGLPVGAAWILGMATVGAVLAAALIAVVGALWVRRLGRRRTRLHLATVALACLIVSGTLLHYGVI